MNAIRERPDDIAKSMANRNTSSRLIRSGWMTCALHMWALRPKAKALEKCCGHGGEKYSPLEILAHTTLLKCFPSRSPEGQGEKC